MRAKLPHLARASIRQGRFLDSASEDDAEHFCLVNVVVGLHRPTATAPCWFCPRLVDGGYLLVTDYANGNTPGVGRAVRTIRRPPD